MTIKRIFCMIMAVIGGLGVIGSLPLKMIRGTSLGPGMMPMLYSIALILLAAVFALTDNGENKISWKGLFVQPVLDGVIFTALCFSMFVVLCLFGTTAALALFCISALTLLKRMSFRKAVVFGIVWSVVLYVVFVRLLGVPFEQGAIVKSFYKAFIY